MLPLKEIRCEEVVVRKGIGVTTCNHLLVKTSVDFIVATGEAQLYCTSCKGVTVIKAEKAKVGMRQRMSVSVAKVA